jgi:protochlorophyllide reductase
MNNLNSEISYAQDGWEAYGQTKLENILFAQELQRRADAAGLDWFTSVALHPGVWY